MVFVRDLMPFGYCAVDGPVVITTATKNVLGTRSGKRAAIRWDIVDAGRKGVLPLSTEWPQSSNLQLYWMFFTLRLRIIALTAFAKQGEDAAG